MINGTHQLSTVVRGVHGTWPTAPKRWSYSSLNDAEACPRRWMLTRGSYDDLWDGTGYPPYPSLPALIGNVIHRSLEIILETLQARACVSIAEPSAVEAIRELGGYTKLIEQTMADELETLEHNPRAADCLHSLETQLRKELPNVRERVQMATSRTRLVESGPKTTEGVSLPVSNGLPPGSYTEVPLYAKDLRLTGRADLLTINTSKCSITDYKSAAPSEQHAEQVLFYALLWSRDQTINPHFMPIERLVVAYPTRDEVFDPPSEAELDALASQVRDRITKVEQDLQILPPPAHPDTELCSHCSVRHLCEDYWANLQPSLAFERSSVSTPTLDCEVEILERNGSRSWIVGLAEGRSALLRTPTETPGFSIGEKVRLLRLFVKVEEDSSNPVFTMTQFSEAFSLNSST